MPSSSASSIAWGSGSKPRCRAAIAKPSAGRRSSSAAPKGPLLGRRAEGGAAEGVDSIGRAAERRLVVAHLERGRRGAGSGLAGSTERCPRGDARSHVRIFWGSACSAARGGRRAGRRVGRRRRLLDLEHRERRLPRCGWRCMKMQVPLRRAAAASSHEHVAEDEVEPATPPAGTTRASRAVSSAEVHPLESCSEDDTSARGDRCEGQRRRRGARRGWPRIFLRIIHDLLVAEDEKSR